MIVEKILTARPDSKRSYWLDSRRIHRLRRDGGDVIAEHRDGRAHRMPWPVGEPVPQGPEFARVIFDIAAKTKAAAE